MWYHWVLSFLAGGILGFGFALMGYWNILRENRKRFYQVTLGRIFVHKKTNTVMIFVYDNITKLWIISALEQGLGSFHVDHERWSSRDVKECFIKEYTNFDWDEIDFDTNCAKYGIVKDAVLLDGMPYIQKKQINE